MKCQVCSRDVEERFPLLKGGGLRKALWVCKTCLYIDWYQTQGFSFFPLKPKSKEPALLSWKTYQERRPTDDEVLSWRRWVENVAVVTGRVSGNLVVMDFDNYETYVRVFPKHGELEKATYVVKTFRGVHVYLRSRGDPGRTEKYESLKFEYRAEGSYVVGVPSIHPTGVEYKHIGVFELIEVDAQEEKQLILKKLGYEPPTVKRGEASANRSPLKYTPPCIQRLKGVAEGFRNEAAMRLTCFLLREIEMEPDDVWKRLTWWNQFNKPPLEEQELRRVFHSALKGGYRYGCNSLREYCVPGLCPIAKEG